jgi:hypothetical protein
MMKKLLVSLISLLWLINLSAQKAESKYFAFELDPAPYLLQGYSVSLKFSPKSTPRIAYMASIYRSNFPDGMMNPNNRSRGWTDMNIETSYAAFMEFYLNDKRKGFYFGPALFWYNKSVTLAVLNKQTAFSSIYPNLRAGYIWHPFKSLNLYLNPWINLGSEINLDDKNQVQGIEFESNKFNYIIALHIGYCFSL